jgi:hypothetical protein
VVRAVIHERRCNLVQLLEDGLVPERQPAGLASGLWTEEADVVLKLSVTHIDIHKASQQVHTPTHTHKNVGATPAAQPHFPQRDATRHAPERGHICQHLRARGQSPACAGRRQTSQAAAGRGSAAGRTSGLVDRWAAVGCEHRTCCRRTYNTGSRPRDAHQQSTPA